MRVGAPRNDREMRQAEEIARRLVDHGFVHIVRSNLRV
jgi:broad specificity phosphatase PhoE